MSRIFLFLLASIMAAPSYAETILVLGDSLSAAFGMAPERGWVHLLRTQLNSTEGQHRVINASISGETTAGGAARLGRLLERHRPTAVIIELGGNDGLRGMALRDIRRLSGGGHGVPAGRADHKGAGRPLAPRPRAG